MNGVTKNKNIWVIVIGIISKLKDGGECRHTRRDPHHFIIDGKIAYMPIYYENGELKETVIIDTEDIERIKKHKWNQQNNGKHIEGYVNGKVIQLHRFIMNEDKDGIIIDHINRNPLDNRKCNLRRCNSQQNCCNRKTHNKNKLKVKNVRQRKDGKYEVNICKNYKQIYIGVYDSLEEAIVERDKALKKLHGEFASFG